MLTVILCLVATVSAQYPYPAAAPAESLQPYPPPVAQVNVQPEGPYPPARAPEYQKVQPAVVDIPRPQPVVAVPKPQPRIPAPQRLVAFPTPVKVNRYQYQPSPIVRPVPNAVITPQPQSYKPVQTVRVQDSPYPAARYPQKQPYAEGGRLSPGELDAPAPPINTYGLPNKSVPSGSGGELSPEELELPPNTQINLQDKRLQYSHGFSDDKGTKVREQGSLLSTNEGWEYVIAKKGSYSYISPEGIPISVNYIADHNGFRVIP